MSKDFQFDFERLEVYRKALDFIDRIFEVYKELSRDYKISIGSNLVRAALSIANNFAEGNDKISMRERNRYFCISSDSTRECVSVLNVLERQKLVGGERHLKLRQDSREITSMIQGLIRKE